MLIVRCGNCHRCGPCLGFGGQIRFSSRLGQLVTHHNPSFRLLQVGLPSETYSTRALQEQQLRALEEQRKALVEAAQRRALEDLAAQAALEAQHVALLRALGHTGPASAPTAPHPLGAAGGSLSIPASTGPAPTAQQAQRQSPPVHSVDLGPSDSRLAQPGYGPLTGNNTSAVFKSALPTSGNVALNQDNQGAPALAPQLVLSPVGPPPAMAVGTTGNHPIYNYREAVGVQQQYGGEYATLGPSQQQHLSAAGTTGRLLCVLFDCSVEYLEIATMLLLHRSQEVSGQGSDPGADLRHLCSDPWQTAKVYSTHIRGPRHERMSAHPARGRDSMFQHL